MPTYWAPCPVKRKAIFGRRPPPAWPRTGPGAAPGGPNCSHCWRSVAAGAATTARRGGGRGWGGAVGGGGGRCAGRALLQDDVGVGAAEPEGADPRDAAALRPGHDLRGHEARG